MDYTQKYLKYKDKYLKKKYPSFLIPVEVPQLVPLLPLNMLTTSPDKIPHKDKIIVKKFNSVSNAQYFQITEFKINILIFHTIHDYEPQNSSYCGPCTDGCYDIINFVNAISTNKCIDIFHELDFTDQKLKSLDVIPNLLNDIPQPNKERVLKALEFQLNLIETKLVSQNIVVNSIILVEEVKKEGIIVDDKLLNQLVDTYLGLIPQEDFLNQYTKNSLIDIIEQFGQNMVENRLTEAFSNNKKTNVRLHSWDTRKLYIKYTKTINILFFFPELYKLNNDILPTDNTFFDYQIEFNETLTVMLNGFYNKTNPIHPAMLIFYLAGDPELSYKGKIVYDTLFQVFKKYYPEWNLYPLDKLIPLVQKLIQKQINKSQLNKVQFLVTMYRMYLDFNFVDFSFGLMLTEMYSIPRMFKKFDPRKHSRNDQCSQKNIFQNIIYLGGSSHGDYISRFINLYFNNEYQNEIMVKTTELKKKINSLGNKRMYRELCDLSLEDNKKWDELLEQVQYRCVELKSPRSFF